MPLVDRRSIHMRSLHAMALALAITALPGCAGAPPRATPAPAAAVSTLGPLTLADEQLSPESWIARLQAPDLVLMDRAAIDARNARLFATDPSMHDLAKLPAALPREQVRGWIEALSKRPTRTLHGEDGRELAAAGIDATIAAMALDAIPASQPTRFGLVVERAPLRTFPTLQRVFSKAGDTDIDRWQESAEFPGTPVVVAHATRDGDWLFVVSPRYAAWTEARHIAVGAREDVLAYATRTPHRVVTGAKAWTVFTPEAPAVSELQLDMGVRVPQASVGRDTVLQGQAAAFHWPVQLPVRQADGSLGFALALLPRNADSAADALPLTRANIIRQSFKFLGERYGWGHDYNGRDCSGFVSEVYRSMGVQLPRNTGDQARSPVFARTHFEAGDSRGKRMAAVAALDVGDLVFIPGHVMMFVGRIDGMPYVIHDTNGGGYLGADGELRSMHFNGVSLTPLLPLRFDRDHDYVDRITNIVRVAYPR